MSQQGAGPSSLRFWGSTALRAGLCGLFFAASGCSNKEDNTPNPAAVANANVPAAERYKVTADTTDFFLYSPQEKSGADETLKKGTELVMVHRSSGYSRVKIPDGQVGYVGTEDVTQLTAEDVAAENAEQQQLAQATRQRSGGYTIPPEAGNNEGLPSAEPTPKPTPPLPFRY